MNDGACFRPCDIAGAGKCVSLSGWGKGFRFLLLSFWGSSSSKSGSSVAVKSAQQNYKLKGIKITFNYNYNKEII